MKTRTKILTSATAIMLSGILLFVALMIGNRSTAGALSASTRTIELAENTLDNENLFDGFDSVDVSQDNYVFTYSAIKSFDRHDLTDIDTIGYDEDINLDGLEIEYDVVCNAEDGTVALSAETVIDNEQVIDTIYGKVYYNENAEIDVAFNVDGIRYSVRELLSSSALDECSLWGNILHKTLNAGLLVLAVVEPALRFALGSTYEVAKIIILLSQKFYSLNYEKNRKLSQPTGFVSDQSNYKHFSFGISDLDYAGCEVIAGYNLATALNKNITLAEATYLYEAMGIEINLALGFLGSNPYQIGYFLNLLGIKYTMVTKYSTFKTYANNSTQYHMIVSRWNNTSATSKIHTYYAYKQSKTNFVTYNGDSIKPAFPVGSVEDLFCESPTNTFMVAYIVKK